MYLEAEPACFPLLTTLLKSPHLHTVSRGKAVKSMAEIVCNYPYLFNWVQKRSTVSVFAILTVSSLYDLLKAQDPCDLSGNSLSEKRDRKCFKNNSNRDFRKRNCISQVSRKQLGDKSPINCQSNERNFRTSLLQ